MLIPFVNAESKKKVLEISSFLAIPKGLSQQLSRSNEILVASTILSLATNNKGTCHPRLIKINELCGIRSNKTVCVAMGNLRKMGLFSAKRTSTRTGFTYTLLWHPIWAACTNNAAAKDLKFGEPFDPTGLFRFMRLPRFMLLTNFTPGTKLLFAYLADHDVSNCDVWPKYKDICADLGISLRCIKTRLRDLEYNGVIKVLKKNTPENKLKHPVFRFTFRDPKLIDIDGAFIHKSEEPFYPSHGQINTLSEQTLHNYIRLSYKTASEESEANASSPSSANHHVLGGAGTAVVVSEEERQESQNALEPTVGVQAPRRAVRADAYFADLPSQCQKVAKVREVFSDLVADHTGALSRETCLQIALEALDDGIRNRGAFICTLVTRALKGAFVNSCLGERMLAFRRKVISEIRSGNPDYDYTPIKNASVWFTDTGVDGCAAATA